MEIERHEQYAVVRQYQMANADVQRHEAEEKEAAAQLDTIKV